MEDNYQYKTNGRGAEAYQRAPLAAQLSPHIRPAQPFDRNILYGPEPTIQAACNPRMANTQRLTCKMHSPTPTPRGQHFGQQSPALSRRKFSESAHRELGGVPIHREEVQELVLEVGEGDSVDSGEIAEDNVDEMLGCVWV